MKPFKYDFPLTIPTNNVFGVGMINYDKFFSLNGFPKFILFIPWNKFFHL